MQQFILDFDEWKLRFGEWFYRKVTEPQKLASLKLEVGLPLLASMVPGLPEIPDVPGIPKASVEAEFDLKAWSEEMYKKYELKLFKVMGKIG